MVHAPPANTMLAVMAVDHPGGAELHLLRLLRGLTQRGWKATVTTPGHGPLRDRVLAEGWEWRPLPVGGLQRGAGARALPSWPRVRALGTGVAAVYLNGGVCGRLLPALVRSRTRRILHVHDLVSRTPVFWRLADVVLADSRAVADRLAGVEARVVYGPVDLDPPEVPSPWPLSPRPVIGFVGRVEPRKGPLDMVRAAPLVRRELPQARFVVVGDDPFDADPDYTRAVVTAPDIEHHPWMDDARGLMRHLDVLVLPAYEEPFGTVLAEAMAVGTPVVATRVGGLPEVVRDGQDGRLVAPGDPEALAAAILSVLAVRERMSAAARERALEFSASAYVERVEQLIRGIGGA